MSPPEILQWLNVLLLPLLAGIASIRADLAAIKATQEAHHLRLIHIEGGAKP